VGLGTRRILTTLFAVIAIAMVIFIMTQAPKHGCPMDFYRIRNVDDHCNCDFSDQSLAAPLISARFGSSEFTSIGPISIYLNLF
jgi:hypothetical protein